MEKDPKLEARGKEPGESGAWRKVSPEDSVEPADAKEFKEFQESKFEPEEFRAELNELRKSVDQLNAGFNSIKRRFIVGVAMGFGTVIGATIVVSLLAFLLRPLANIEMIRPGVESIIEMMDEERERKDTEDAAQGASAQKAGDEADLPRGNALPDEETPEPQAEPQEE